VGISTLDNDDVIILITIRYTQNRSYCTVALAMNDGNFSDGASLMSSGLSASSERADFECSQQNSYVMMIINMLAAAIAQYASGLYDRQAYHTSALTGHAWVLKLLTGHPDCIQGQALCLS
jgi:hypothetical protein